MRRAFTLIELIMVIVILGVMSVIIVPKMYSIKPASVEMAARLVRDDIRYAVDYAINTGLPVRIEFNMSGDTGYEFRKRLPDGSWGLLSRPGESTPFSVTLGSSDYREAKLTEVNIHGTDWIYINSSGICLDRNLVPLSKAMNCYIVLNETKYIDIEPVSSLVRLRN